MGIVSSATKDEGGSRAESSLMSHIFSKGIFNLVEKLGKSAASWSVASGAYSLGLDLPKISPMVGDIARSDELMLL